MCELFAPDGALLGFSIFLICEVLALNYETTV